MHSRELAQRFEKLFGQSPRIFRAPGRVNLIGEHTDYNDGFVMPAAVGFSTYVAIAKRPDRDGRAGRLCPAWAADRRRFGRVDRARRLPLR